MAEDDPFSENHRVFGFKGQRHEILTIFLLKRFDLGSN